MLAWSVSSQGHGIVRQFNFRAKKRLGQHFLVDEHVVECILSASELNRDDIVVEVGPGLGVLTKKLADHVSKVIAVELDSKLVSILRKRLSPFSNIKIIHADILKIAPWQLLENNFATSEPKLRAEGVAISRGYKVVANLPYYITSPVLRHFLETSLKPQLMVVMVQSEVGEAIAAIPGKMSLLSVRTQFYSKPSIIAHVPAESFHPQPKVNSVILRLDVYSKPSIEISDIAGFFDIVSCGFSSPRKQLRNSLAQSLGISPSQIALLLETTGIEVKRRAETLSLEEWKKIWEVFAPFRKCS